MRDHQGRFPVAAMWRVLAISPSGFYAWMKRPPSARAERDAVILAHLLQFHARSDGTYGAPRLLGDLRDIDFCVGQKRVARVMKLGGIRGVSRRPYTITTRRGPEETEARGRFDTKPFPRRAILQPS